MKTDCYFSISALFSPSSSDVGFRQKDPRENFLLIVGRLA